MKTEDRCYKRVPVRLSKLSRSQTQLHDLGTFLLESHKQVSPFCAHTVGHHPGTFEMYSAAFTSGLKFMVQ